MSAWKPEEDIELKTLFLEGITILEISNRISTNRNPAGIRSRLEKLGLKREKPRPANWRKPIGDLKDVKPPLVIKEVKPPFVTLDISIMELTNHTCRAMTGDKVYCGHAANGSYCNWHHNRYYARSLKGDYNVSK